jgi:hypothetical protein
MDLRAGVYPGSFGPHLLTGKSPVIKINTAFFEDNGRD